MLTLFKIYLNQRLTNNIPPITRNWRKRQNLSKITSQSWTKDWTRCNYRLESKKVIHVVYLKQVVLLVCRFNFLNHMFSQKFLVLTVCLLLLVMNVFDEVTAFNIINFHNDGLKLREKLTVINIDKYKIESFLKTFLSFLNQLFILRSGDVDLNPGPLTIYIILVQYFTRKSTHLKLFHMNCQSLLKKKHVLQYMMNDLDNNTTLAFSETWLKENDDEKFFMAAQ